MRNLFFELKSGIIAFYSFISEKRATTFAGGLAYFFFAGLVPFVGILTLSTNFFGIDDKLVKDLFQSELLSVYFEKLRLEGVSRTGTWIMVLTGAYSATNFYFHLIRTGECIYGKKRGKGVWKRVLSFIYLFAVQILMICVLAVELAGRKILGFFGFSAVVVEIMQFAVSVAFNITLSLILHIFAAPSGNKNLKKVGAGVLLTFIYWELCNLFFNIYRSIKPENEFGFTLIAVFLLYLYFIMRGLTYGMARNSFNDNASLS